MAAKREAEFEFYTVQENSGSGNVPAFLSKLWTLVEDPSNDEIICWDSQGNSFHIYDQSRFAMEVLPYYFKHNNISSFIRQLNMYGFRKVPNMEQGGLKVEKDDMEFQHPYFLRGHEQLLERIKRKTSQARVEQRPAMNVDPDSFSKVLKEVAQIKSKQDSFNTTMTDLKRENQILWREVIKLSKKYQQQQQIINKIMQFLLSLVNKHSRGMPGLARKRPLMINAPQPSDTTDTSPPKKANFLLNDAGDHDYTVQSPADTQSPATPTMSGVVIQELLDHLEPSLVTPSPLDTVSLDVVKEEPAASASPFPSHVLTNSGKVGDSGPVTVTILPQSNTQSLLTTQSVPPPAQPQPLPSPSLASKPLTSQQIALRGVKDKPLSASSSPQSAKDISEQMKLLQCDLDNVREALSSGQFNLDPSFILGLFDPETPLPVSLDPSFLDAFGTLASGEEGGETSTLSAPVTTTTTGSVSGTGSELSQYQPLEFSIPNLFDELDNVTPSDDTTLPVFFDGSDDVLHTPAITDRKPFDSDVDKLITVDDVD